MLFDWLGTDDFSSWLVVPDAIAVIGGSHPDGWGGVRAKNHQLVLEARSMLLTLLGQSAPAPDGMIGSMASVQMPDSTAPRPAGDLSPLMFQLEDAGFEVIVLNWPEWPHQVLRVSAHLYNTIAEYQGLVSALEGLIWGRGPQNGGGRNIISAV
jgi:isopenicillin-N epimerase